MRKRILIVDDEQSICEIVAFNLRRAGYEAQVAHSAREALSMEPENFDLILLDVMMNEMNGFELAQVLRRNEVTRTVPIVFMTAKGSESDVLHGFELGADDYIDKPFSVKELVARVKAVLARSEHHGSRSEELRYQSLVLNLKNASLTIDGEVIAVTRLEFDLMRLFLSNRGRVFSREQIIASAWPKNVSVSSRTVDVSITRLRRKIGFYAKNIVTKTGFGYCFE